MRMVIFTVFAGAEFLQGTTVQEVLIGERRKDKDMTGDRIIDQEYRPIEDEDNEETLIRRTFFWLDRNLEDLLVPFLGFVFLFILFVYFLSFLSSCPGLCPYLLDS